MIFSTHFQHLRVVALFSAQLAELMI